MSDGLTDFRCQSSKNSRIWEGLRTKVALADPPPPSLCARSAPRPKNCPVVVEVAASFQADEALRRPTVKFMTLGAARLPSPNLLIFRGGRARQEISVSCTVSAALPPSGIAHGPGAGPASLVPCCRLRYVAENLPHVAVGERAGPLGELFKPWLLLSPGPSAVSTSALVLILQHAAAVYAKATLLREVFQESPVRFPLHIRTGFLSSKRPWEPALAAIVIGDSRCAPQHRLC